MLRESRFRPDIAGIAGTSTQEKPKRRAFDVGLEKAKVELRNKQQKEKATVIQELDRKHRSEMIELIEKHAKLARKNVET